MLREKFVKDFDENLANILELCATEHENGLHQNKGSDYFRYVLMLTISYQCFEVANYRKYHKIPNKYTYKKIKDWIIKNAEMAKYDGDPDYIAVLVGAYDEYINKK